MITIAFAYLLLTALVKDFSVNISVFGEVMKLCGIIFYRLTR